MNGDQSGEFLTREKSLLFVFYTLLNDQGFVTLGYSRLAQKLNVNLLSNFCKLFLPTIFFLDALKYLVKIDRMRKIPLD